METAAREIVKGCGENRAGQTRSGIQAFTGTSWRDDLIAHRWDSGICNDDINGYSERA